MIPKERSTRRGSAVVEAALTLSAVLLLIIGTLDIARVVFMHQMISERAGKAVRWGAAHDFNETSIKNVLLYGSATPAEGAQPLFGLGNDNVSVIKEAGANGAPDRVRMTISGWNYRFLTPYIGGQSVIAPNIVTSMTMENP